MKQLGLTRNGEMRERHTRNIALHHQQDADARHLHSLVAAHCQAVLMFAMQHP
jgi:hypothetical protein